MNTLSNGRARKKLLTLPLLCHYSAILYFLLGSFSPFPTIWIIELSTNFFKILLTVLSVIEVSFIDVYLIY